MMNKNLEEKVTSHIIFIFLTVIAVTGNQCCLQFSGSSCLTCPTGMHLYRSNCIFDLEGCDKYSNGFDCSECRQFYSLLNGTCKHARFPPSLTNSTDFQVYLQSNLKPDHVLDIALKKISILDTWVDWLSYSLLLNKTYLNRNTLIRNAQKIMNSIISSQKLHYIFTGNQSRNDTQLLYYRLTYELNLIGGFADCIVAVEMINGSINYMELNEVKQRSLDRDGVWQEMKHGGENQTYALSKVEEIFGKKESSEFLKGYIKQNSEDLNITMFFMDKIEGVVAYIYIADKSQLPTTKTEQLVIDRAPSQVSSKTLQISKQIIVPTQIKPTNNTIVQIDNKFGGGNKQKEIPTGTNHKNNSSQIQIKMSELDNNPIFLTGYALYLNLYATTKAPILLSIFYQNQTSIVYGMKIKNEESKEVYRFSFKIDEGKSEIEVISFEKQKPQNIISTDPSIVSPSSNFSQPSNSTSIPSIIIQQSSNPIFPSKTTQTASPNTSLPVSCNLQTRSQLIDITNKQSSDIFLPQINLVLKSMYDNLLANTLVSSVKYSLGTQDSSVSNISYYITYKTPELNYLDFQVAIINNQFQLVRYPNTTSSASPLSSSTVNNPISTNNSTQNNITVFPTTISSNSTIQINDTKPQQKNILNTTSIDNLTNLTASQIKEGNTAPIINRTIVYENITSSIKELNLTEAEQNNNKTIFESTKKDQNISNKNSQSSKIQANTSSSILPENRTEQSQPQTTPESSMIVIPQKNYTTQPRYKSLITILRSLYRIPSNATIQSMKTWQLESSGDRNYQIIFRMIYQKPINDDTIAKISSYNVSVNSNSFVSVLKQTISYEKKPILSLPKGSSLSRSYTPDLPKPPHLFIGPLPSNLNIIYDILTLHSPILKDYNLQSLRHDQGPKNFVGMVSNYVQKVKFSSINNQPICFDITYQTTTAQKQTNDSLFVNIITYFLVNCPIVSTIQQLVPNLNVSAIHFDEADSIDPKILTLIQKISNVLQIEVVTKEIYNNFMRIRYKSTAFGIRQILIDTSQMFILTYQSSPQLLYSQSNSKQSLIRVEIIEKIRCQIEIIMKLPPKTIIITIIEKHSENMELIMLDIVCKNRIKTFWYSKINEMIKVQAVYFVQKSLIKIISMNSEGLFYGNHIIKSSAIQNWGELSIKQTLEEPLFCMLMANIKREYTSFIENTTLLSAYIEISNTKTLHDYLSNDQGAFVMLAISKRYTAAYYATYLLKVKFYAAKNVTMISNLQALSLSNIAINGCFVLQNEKTNQIPVCASCKDGYRIFQGFCQPIIDGCIEYSMSKCVKCNNTMLISQDMQSCLALDNPVEQALSLKSISYYK